MILHVLRYRRAGEQEWQSWKFSHTQGRLRCTLALSAKPAVLAQFAAAVDYALSGTASVLIAEVAMQLSDHGGHMWQVQRRGDLTRISRDQAACAPATAEAELAEAWLDASLPRSSWSVGAARLPIGHFELQHHDNGLRIAALGDAQSPLAALKDAAQAQMQAVAAACAQRLQRPGLALPRVLTTLARSLEPLKAQYAELCRQYNELKQDSKELAASDSQQAAGLTKELVLLDQLAAAAEPLMQPGVNYKVLRDELNKVEAEHAELTHTLGLDLHSSHRERDFSGLIAALARLEAQEQLIKATEAARQQAEQRVEPLFKRYFELAEGGLASDQAITAELSACLASLSLRLRQQAAQRSDQQAGDKQKTWFDRFKSRGSDAAADFEDPATYAEVADLETAHTGITYALGRLSDLGADLATTRSQHASVLSAIGQAHEALVRSFARLRDAWQTAATAANLPATLDLSQLIQIASWHGTLTTLEHQRRLCRERLERYATAASKVERLLIDWRKATGSQKTVDLSNQMVLLSEAANLLRYRDGKRQRLDQLAHQGVEIRAAGQRLATLKRQRQQLAHEWSTACAAAGIEALEVQSEVTAELFKAAHLVQALALVHSQVDQGPTLSQLRLLQSGERAVSLYRWNEEHTQTTDRLALLAALDAVEPGEGSELQIILLADESLGTALAPMGLGRIVAVAASEPRHALPAAPVAAAKLAVPGAPKPTPNVIKATLPSRVATPPSKGTQPAGNALLSERARQTLAVLTAKKP